MKTIIEVENVIFIVDPKIEFFGDVNDDNEYQQFLKLRDFHAAMSVEFEDQTNLDEFKNLLVADPNTAFLVYNENHGRSFNS